MYNLDLKDRLNEITRLAFALLENIGDEKLNRCIAMPLGLVRSKYFCHISICGR